jgi:hypothetical protein
MVLAPSSSAAAASSLSSSSARVELVSSFRLQTWSIFDDYEQLFLLEQVISLLQNIS